MESAPRELESRMPWASLAFPWAEGPGTPEGTTEKAGGAEGLCGGRGSSGA